MPQTTSQSSLLAELAAKGKAAHEKHKDDPINYGNPSLPAGIEGGIAQLTYCRFGKFKDGENKGKPFFMARGTVLEPVSHEGARVQGMSTSIGPEPLCDTPKAQGKRKTFDDHYAWIRNQLRLLGMDKDTGITQWEMVAAALEKSQPTFTFRTWKGKKQTSGPYANQEPRVYHEWSGLCNFSSNGDATTLSTVDHSANGEVTEETPTEFSEFSENEQLGAKADEGDIEAQKNLKEQAIALGIEESDVDNANNWQEVVQMIATASEGGGEGEGEAEAQEGEGEGEGEAIEEPTTPDPEKGDCMLYQPRDAKGNPAKDAKGKVIKKIQVEVLSVNAEKRTCTVKDSATKKPIVNAKKQPIAISWDHLETMST